MGGAQECVDVRRRVRKLGLGFRASGVSCVDISLPGNSKSSTPHPPHIRY